MQAYQVTSPGGPEALELKELPNPSALPGQALIQIKAFGLNRAEATTRMGDSGKNVPFPRVIGIECVGLVMDCPGNEVEKGQVVACAMGEMGRQYDGSYAELTVVPISNVFPIETGLDWTRLAAIPETYFTAWGCCFEALQLTEKPKVVVRPGASALGVAITQIVNHMGGEVIGVTRSQSKVQRLLGAGMKDVIVSSDTVAVAVLKHWPEGASGVVDTIVSEVSLADDFAMKSSEAKICLAGSLASTYGSDKPIRLMEAIEMAKKKNEIAFYDSSTISVEKNGKALQTIVERVEAGEYDLNIDTVFQFKDLVKAHEGMDRNAFAGKVVVKH